MLNDEEWKKRPTNLITDIDLGWMKEQKKKNKNSPVPVQIITVKAMETVEKECQQHQHE